MVRASGASMVTLDARSLVGQLRSTAKPVMAKHALARVSSSRPVVAFGTTEAPGAGP